MALADSRSTETGQATAQPYPSCSRKDRGRRHVTRHLIQSRYPLEALERAGENVRSLRHLERQLRAELKPAGAVGDVLFDRFFSSYLRCLLAAKSEMQLRAADLESGAMRSAPVPPENDAPVIIWERAEINAHTLSGELLGKLALLQRYDLHFSREMYRNLVLLLSLRDGDKASLPHGLGRMFGIHPISEEDNQ
jgi:hypothetical protein